MSETRKVNDPSTPASPNATTPTKPYSYGLAASEGAGAAFVSTTVNFPVNYIGYILKTFRTPGKTKPPTFFQACRIAAKHPFNGYSPAIFNSIFFKNIPLFITKAWVENRGKKINPDSNVIPHVASFVGGIISLLAYYPGSVIITMRWDNISVPNILSQFNIPTLYRGVYSAATGAGIQSTVFFGMKSILSNYCNPICAGSLANVMGSGISYPFFVISDNQKQSGEDFYKTTTRLFNEGGPKRFYRAYLTTNIFHMALKGGLMTGGMMLGKEIYNTLTHSMPDEITPSAAETERRIRKPI